MKLLRAGRPEAVLPEGDAFVHQRFAEPARHGVPAAGGERCALFGEEVWLSGAPAVEKATDAVN